MHYLRNVVILTFRALHPEVNTVTSATIQTFDQTLFDTFDAEARTQAGVKGIAINDFNLSMLVAFSAMTDAPTVHAQVTIGCNFFLSITPVP